MTSPRKLVVVLLAVTALLTVNGFSPSTAQALPSKRTWQVDVRHAMRGSIGYVDRRVDHGGRHLAVNLDIDNTSLASYYAPGHPVRPVLRFAKYARAHGVRLLFNTGRPNNKRSLAHARRHLTAAGYRVTEICGRRHGEGLAHSKQRCRRHFVAQGYTVIANVGNRRTDFVGGDYDRAFRLPNYRDRLG